MYRCWYVWAFFVASSSAFATNTTLPQGQGADYAATSHVETLSNHAFGPPDQSQSRAPSRPQDEKQPSPRTAWPTFAFGHADGHPADQQTSETSDYPYHFQGHSAVVENHALGPAGHPEQFGPAIHGEHFGPLPYPGGLEHPVGFHGGPHHGGRERLEHHAGHGGYRYQSDIAMGVIGFLIVLSTLQSGLFNMMRQTTLLEALHGRRRRDTDSLISNTTKGEEEGGAHGWWMLHQDGVLRCAQRRACEANRLLVTRYGLAGRHLARRASRMNFKGPRSSDWMRLVRDAGMAGLKGEDCDVLYRGCKNSRYMGDI